MRCTNEAIDDILILLVYAKDVLPYPILGSDPSFWYDPEEAELLVYANYETFLIVKLWWLGVVRSETSIRGFSLISYLACSLTIYVMLCLLLMIPWFRFIIGDEVELCIAF